MLFDPSIQIKPIECDSVFADGNDGEPRANVAVEHSASYATVGWGIAVADQPRLNQDGHGESTIVWQASVAQRLPMPMHAIDRCVGPARGVSTSLTLSERGIAVR